MEGEMETTAKSSVGGENTKQEWGGWRRNEAERPEQVGGWVVWGEVESIVGGGSNKGSRRKAGQTWEGEKMSSVETDRDSSSTQTLAGPYLYNKSTKMYWVYMVYLDKGKQAEIHSIICAYQQQQMFIYCPLFGRSDHQEFISSAGCDVLGHKPQSLHNGTNCLDSVPFTILFHLRKWQKYWSRVRVFPSAATTGAICFP